MVQPRDIEQRLQRRALVRQPGLAQMHAVEQDPSVAAAAAGGQLVQRLDRRVVARTQVLHGAPYALIGAKLRRCSGHGPCSRSKDRCCGVP
ncbi:Uncharacterised protein [Bordetella pertussis]|nr:Uncharacterised protein [Bordetella pertussis]